MGKEAKGIILSDSIDLEEIDLQDDHIYLVHDVDFDIADNTGRGLLFVGNDQSKCEKAFVAVVVRNETFIFGYYTKDDLLAEWDILKDVTKEIKINI